jgi:hypothetical protein
MTMFQQIKKLFLSAIVLCTLVFWAWACATDTPNGQSDTASESDTHADTASVPDTHTDTVTDSSDAPPVQEHVFFDDFTYETAADSALRDMGWYLRSGTGGPGPDDCTWSADAISFHEQDGQTVVRLTAATDGTGSGTQQAEIGTPVKFLTGTYAARIRFTDAPVSGGVNGDQIVETFFSITP